MSPGRSSPWTAAGRRGSVVFVTDYAWPSTDVEAGILARAGARLLVAETGEEDELVSLAREADAVLEGRRPRNVVNPEVLALPRWASLA